MQRLVFFGALIVSLLGAFTAAAARAAAREVPPLRQAIEEANKAFMAAFAARDAAAVAGLYTVDAQLLPPNSGILEGRAAIEAFWQAVMDMGIASAQLDIQEVDALGNTAVEVSLYTLYLANGQVADHGKYIVEWKHQQGQWFLHRDIFNTSQPLAS